MGGDGLPGIEASEQAFSVIEYAWPEQVDAGVGVQGRTRDEAMANARLIAAAPELLAALIRITEEGYANTTDLKIAERAIAKATGAA